MRNAQGGKPASMGLSVRTVQIAGALIALFAFLSLSLAVDAQKVHAAIVKGSVKITVVDVTGAQPTNVTLTIKKKGSSRTLATASGTTITFSVEPATYVLTRSGTTKYKTWGGDCNAVGEVVIVSGVQANCTLSNAVATTPPPTGDSGGTVPSRTDIRTR